MVIEKGVRVLVVEDAPVDAGQIASFPREKSCPWW